MGQAIRRAMVVEDNVMLGGMLRQMLEDIGFTVVAVVSASDARDMIAHGSIDVLLTDLQLDNAPDGLLIAREAIERLGGIRVVIASGHPIPDGIGEIGFLPKPFTVAQLQHAILA